MLEVGPGALDRGAGRVAAGPRFRSGLAAGVVGLGAVTVEVSGNAFVSVPSAGPLRVAARAADVNPVAAAITAQTAIISAHALINLRRVQVFTSRLTAMAPRGSRTVRGNSEQGRSHCLGFSTTLSPDDLQPHTHAGTVVDLAL